MCDTAAQEDCAPTIQDIKCSSMAAAPAPRHIEEEETVAPTPLNHEQTSSDQEDHDDDTAADDEEEDNQETSNIIRGRSNRMAIMTVLLVVLSISVLVTGIGAAFFLAIPKPVVPTPNKLADDRTQLTVLDAMVSLHSAMQALRLDGLADVNQTSGGRVAALDLFSRITQESYRSAALLRALPETDPERVQSARMVQLSDDYQKKGIQIADGAHEYLHNAAANVDGVKRKVWRARRAFQNGDLQDVIQALCDTQTFTEELHTSTVKHRNAVDYFRGDTVQFHKAYSEWHGDLQRKAFTLNETEKRANNVFLPMIRGPSNEELSAMQTARLCVEHATGSTGSLATIIGGISTFLTEAIRQLDGIRAKREANAEELKSVLKHYIFGERLDFSEERRAEFNDLATRLEDQTEAVQKGFRSMHRQLAA